MPINQEVNVILKRMWSIDEQINAGDILNEEDINFFNSNIKLIQDYYVTNSKYWGTKEGNLKTLVNNLKYYVDGKLSLDSIINFKDICYIANVNPKIFNLPPDSSIQDFRINAYKKLELIVDVLNEGWKPNWSDSNENKYYPYFKFNNEAGRFSSFGFSFLRVSSYVGSHLVFKTKEFAIFVGKIFIDIYNDYMLY